MILVAGNIDRRDLALSERVIKRVVDLADRDAQSGGRIAVDHDIGFGSFVLLVAVDVGQVGVALQGGGDLRRPFVELLEGRTLKRKLILCLAGAAADADVLYRLQKQGRSRNDGHFAPQPRNHAVRRNLAFAERFQRNEYKTGIGLPAAGEADRGIDGRIVLDDADELRELLLHQLKRNTLIGLDRADEPAGVLLREEALWNDDVEIEVETYDRDEYQNHREGMAKRDRQG